ncbi:MAG: Asp-tRNA(Asn)/Glu-tRNA(Gln) amidotransferase subunit GatC, partial [Candidatus Doudnabacteria bacterium]|nr:Asp-tRNA(Asn)/Glu-tRNA(Gln) amidotransferase subunit GatC [Candidatus Doudnabacteria bacterium]
MSITKKDIEHVAKLARLALSEKEKDKLTRDVASILEYVAKLNEVNTKGVDLSLAEHKPINQWRLDESEDFGIQEAILRVAPKRKQRFFEAKGVFEG